MRAGRVRDIFGRVIRNHEKIIIKKLRYWYLVSLPIRDLRPVGPFSQEVRRQNSRGTRSNKFESKVIIVRGYWVLFITGSKSLCDVIDGFVVSVC